MEHSQKRKKSKPYSPEFRERAVRLLLEHSDEYQSEAATLVAIAGKLGCSPDSLNRPGFTHRQALYQNRAARPNRQILLCKTVA